MKSTASQHGMLTATYLTMAMVFFSSVYKAKCIHQVLHISHFRGASFREDYLRVPKLRSIIHAPVLMLTATATEDMVKDIKEKLHLDPPVTVKMVAVLPDR